MKVKVYVRTKIINSKTEHVIEVEKEEWDEMDDYKKDRYILDYIFQNEMIEWGYEEV